MIRPAGSQCSKIAMVHESHHPTRQWQSFPVPSVVGTAVNGVAVYIQGSFDTTQALIPRK